MTRSAAIETRTAPARGRVADYFELTKPRVTLMVVAATLAGYCMAGNPGLGAALNLILGTALASGGTLALNEYVERDTDALMARTWHRPLPEKRLRPSDAMWFGIVTALLGLAYLWIFVNPLAGAITAVIGATYLFAYTPLKRVSWSCNIVGAIPGALPPVAGWAAARGTLQAPAWVMFAIMMAWQMPHALSIAKLYREDYRRARLWLAPLDHPETHPENPVIIGGCLALLAIGALPTLMGFAGITYLAVATALGLGLLGCAAPLVRGPETAAAARRVMLATLVYLPITLLVMVLDRI